MRCLLTVAGSIEAEGKQFECRLWFAVSSGVISIEQPPFWVSALEEAIPSFQDLSKRSSSQSFLIKELRTYDICKRVFLGVRNGQHLCKKEFQGVAHRLGCGCVPSLGTSSTRSDASPKDQLNFGKLLRRWSKHGDSNSIANQSAACSYVSV